MCPLSPGWLAGRTSFEIEDDTPCRRCGYNLVGMRSDQQCPECGTPITDVTLYGAPSVNDRPGRVLRNSGSLLDAPRAYVTSLCGASSALGIGALLTLVLLVGSVKAPILALIATVPALMYAVGVLGVTRPRQLGTKAEIDTRAEWRDLRTTARWTQWLWIVYAGWIGARAFVELPPLHWVVLVVAFGGLLALGQVLAHLTFWAGDTRLAFRWRASIYVFPVGALVITGLYLGDMVPPRATVEEGLDLILIVTSFFTLLSVGFLLVVARLFWEVHHVGRWTMRNLARQDARADARRARRANNPQAVNPVQAAEEPAAHVLAHQLKTKQAGHVVEKTDDLNPYDIE